MAKPEKRQKPSAESAPRFGKLGVDDLARARGGGWQRPKDADGQTPLPHAAYDFDDTQRIGMLAKAGANVNAQDTEGGTPLMLDAKWDVRATDALLNAGADVHANDRKGWTALDHAVVAEEGGADNSAVRKLLTERGARFSRSRYDRFTTARRATRRRLFTETGRGNFGGRVH